MRRVVIISTASGNGKTTVGRALADRLDVPFYELDALHHGPNWAEPTLEDFRARVEPLVQSDAWVIDGAYRGKLGDLVLAGADLVVWLDLPLRVWLPRLVRRTASRVIRREELWNGNRERLRDALHPQNSVVFFALRHYRERRQKYPSELASFPVVRLRTTAEVDDFLRSAPRRGAK
ncbi:MAG: shikimate kinase [Gaiellaceae bacterium]|nr:adenylate kinase [Actinomycetota bacterium]